MKKKVVIGLIAVVAIVAVAIFTGCIDNDDDSSSSTPTPTPTSTPSVTPAPTTNAIFTLKSWEVIDDEGRAKLLLKINLTDDVFMVLLNPDGDVVCPTGHPIIGPFGGVTEISLDQKYYTEVIKGRKAVRLFLTRHRHEIPQIGTWTLIVRDKSGDTIDTKDFTFKGPELEFVNITRLDWVENYMHYNEDALRFSFTVRNKGDLPAYLGSCWCSLDGGKWEHIDRYAGSTKWKFHPNKEFEVSTIRAPCPSCVPPNQTKLILRKPYSNWIYDAFWIGEIPPEKRPRILTITLKDRNGSVLLKTDVTIPK